MKKVIGLGLIFVMSFVLVGCGGAIGDKVTCTTTNTDDDGTTTAKITATFQNDKLTYIVSESIMAFNEKEMATMTYAFMPDVTSKLEKMGFKVDSSIKGSTITMTFKGDMKTISQSEGFEDLDYSFDYDRTKEEYITSMESGGYTCK